MKAAACGSAGAASPTHLGDADRSLRRKRTESPESLDIVEVEAQHRPDRHPGLHDMLAGMDIGDERLQPVGDELYRPAEQF